MSEIVKVEKVELSNFEIENLSNSLINLMQVKDGLDSKTKYRLGNIKKQILKINEKFMKFVREEIFPKYAQYDENGELVNGEPHPYTGQPQIVFKSKEDEIACSKEMNKLKEEKHEISFVRMPFSIFEDERVNKQIDGNVAFDLSMFIALPNDLKY